MNELDTNSAMGEAEEGYKAHPEFEVDAKEPLLQIDLTDSSELWLIQWPIGRPDDLHGKELSLKLHHDGRLASFEDSSGKCYDMVSFAAQEPDATVFVSSTSESKVVGRISRRVCLARYPEPDELEKPRSNDFSLVGLTEGSRTKSMSQSFRTPSWQGSHPSSGVSHETLTSTYSMGQRSKQSPQSSHKKRRADSASVSDIPMRSAERSWASEVESRMMNASLGSELSHGEKSKKKKMKAEE